MKRSQSTSSDLDDSPESEFRRGGVRATAGPRLGWSRDLQRSNNKYIQFVCLRKLFVCFFLPHLFRGRVTCIVDVSLSEQDSPFSRWSKEQVCEWLQEQGLGLYINQAQQWISSGQTLLKASQHDLEKVS